MNSTSESLLAAVSGRGAHDAADLLEKASSEDAAKVLQQLNPMIAQQVLEEMEEQTRTITLTFAPKDKARQWISNREHPEDSVGWLMEPPVAVFRPEATVRDTIEEVRKLAKKAFITYGYVTDARDKLLGLLIMRDLMLAEPDTRLVDVMLRDPFTLDPDLELTDAMKIVVNKHYPVYPVCNKDGVLLGLVRGQSLFEARAIEISAQAGTMVGVEKEERQIGRAHV